MAKDGGKSPQVTSPCVRRLLLILMGVYRCLEGGSLVPAETREVLAPIVWGQKQ